MDLTSRRVVLVFAATLLLGHARAILQNRVARTTAGLPALGGVQALRVAMEIRAGAGTGLPTGPLLLTSAAVCRRQEEESFG